MAPSPPLLFPEEDGEGEGAGAGEGEGEGEGEGVGSGVGLGEAEALLGDGSALDDDDGEGATFTGTGADVAERGSAEEDDGASSQSGSPEGSTVDVGNACAADEDALADGVQYGLRLSLRFSVASMGWQQSAKNMEPCLNSQLSAM
jgi:hypothetical protein